MTRATRDANQRENQSTEGESKIPSLWKLPTNSHHRAKQFRSNWLGRHTARDAPKKNFERLYQVLAPGPTIIKLSPTTSTIKEPGKSIVTVNNSDIAKFGTLQERQTPLKVYADRRGPGLSEKLIDEQIQAI